LFLLFFPQHFNGKVNRKEEKPNMERVQSLFIFFKFMNIRFLYISVHFIFFLQVTNGFIYFVKRSSYLFKRKVA